MSYAGMGNQSFVNVQIENVTSFLALKVKGMHQKTGSRC